MPRCENSAESKHAITTSGRAVHKHNTLTDCQWRHQGLITIVLVRRCIPLDKVTKTVPVTEGAKALVASCKSPRPVCWFSANVLPE